jgi:hypothetical protein
LRCHSTARQQLPTGQGDARPAGSLGSMTFHLELRVASTSAAGRVIYSILHAAISTLTKKFSPRAEPRKSGLRQTQSGSGSTERAKSTPILG